MREDGVYRVVIPTRDSGAWIAKLVGAYRSLGVEPLLLYDRRSCDNTLDQLERVAADFIQVEPSVDRVEGMLSATRSVTDTEWVVRLDDDEFPSQALLAWLDLALAKSNDFILAMSRRDTMFVGGQLMYSRLEDYYFHPDDPTFLNPQWRAFRPRKVDFFDLIHTPGFDASLAGKIPPDAYFVHFDWVLRSFRQRWVKLEGYESQAEGAGWGYARFYLPELHAQRDLRWTSFRTSEFDSLARSLARIKAGTA